MMWGGVVKMGWEDWPIDNEEFKKKLNRNFKIGITFWGIVYSALLICYFTVTKR